jgi:hypothetical protein
MLSEERDHELKLSQKLMMKVHLSMCVFCRRMASQLRFIEGVTQRMGAVSDESPITHPEIFSATLSQEAKTRMRNILGGGKIQ